MSRGEVKLFRGPQPKAPQPTKTPPSSLKPFFTYYGGKWRAALRYPPPRFSTIVEPFAGSAGYSVRYPDRKVILNDADPRVAGVWRYLIGASRAEILALPLMGPDDCVDDLLVPQEAKWLIGFWLNKGAASPRRRPSAWMRGGTHASSFWGEEVRARIADQVERINHWQVMEGPYSQVEAPPKSTWFIDPPV